MYKTTQVQNTISITQPLETISIAQLFQFQGMTKDKKKTMTNTGKKQINKNRSICHVHLFIFHFIHHIVTSRVNCALDAMF
jgi:uncharacterized protein YvpB